MAFGRNDRDHGEGSDIYGCARCETLVVVPKGKEPKALKKIDGIYLCPKCEKLAVKA